MDTPLSITEQPESPNGGFAIVLGPRQITAVLVVAIFAVGIFCSLSYIVGRAASRASAPPPGSTHTAAPAPKPLTLMPVPCPAAPAQTSAIAAVPEWKNAAPVAGGLYLQVMSVEPGVAEVFARGLHDVGIEAIAAPGTSAAVQRVLVGPVTDQSIGSVRAQLEKHGFHWFARKYETNPAPEPPKPRG